MTTLDPDLYALVCRLAGDELDITDEEIAADVDAGCWYADLAAQAYALGQAHAAKQVPAAVLGLAAGEPPDHTVLRHTRPNPAAGDHGVPDQIVTILWRDDHRGLGDQRWFSSAHAGTPWADQTYTWPEIYGDGTGLTPLVPAAGDDEACTCTTEHVQVPSASGEDGEDHHIIDPACTVHVSSQAGA